MLKRSSGKMIDFGEDMVNRNDRENKRKTEDVTLLPAHRGNEGVHCTVHCTW